MPKQISFKEGFFFLFIYFFGRAYHHNLENQHHKCKQRMMGWDHGMVEWWDGGMMGWDEMVQHDRVGEI